MSGALGRRLAIAAIAAITAAASANASASPPLPLRPLPGPRATTALLLARGGEGGSLPLAVTLLPLDARAPRRVLAIAEVEGRALAAAASDGRLGVELHLYAVAADGAIVASRSEALAIDLARHGDRLEAGVLRWVAQLELGPGAHVVRVHVREHFSEGFAQRQVMLAPAGGEAAAGGLFLASPASPSLALPALSPTVGVDERELLALLGGGPDPLPRLAGGASAELRIATPTDRPAPERLLLLDPLGRTVAELATRVAAPGGVAAGVRLDALELDLPPLSGRFLLAPGSPAAGAQPSPVALTFEGAPPTGAPEALAAPPDDARELRAAWRAAWLRFAAGEREQAIATLMALESGLPPRRAAERLAASEGVLLDRLRRRAPADLLPLALLYLDLERAWLAEGRFVAARRARKVAESIAESLAAAARGERQRELAAGLLEALAAGHLEARDAESAARLLGRAAELVPGRAEPWLALGILHERDRRLERAAAAFDRALAAAPDLREARLRRARVGLLAGERDALAELERLAETAADWVAVVAAQERARGYLAQGEHAEAAAYLAPLVERRPEEPSLALARAYALERAGRRAEARALAAGAAWSPPTAESAPRKRYADTPARALGARRAEVERAALLALGTLAQRIEEDPLP